ncbi:MAG TPA: DUF4037 domain-containing protein [Streptosporangiaceae bacterium]|nr:DUF4037 domain-containing protein [Streptosporangiaceae bacterium]
MTATFIPGLELARLFYAEAVRPLLDENFPGLPHTAALIGPGSEVLGLDTPRSTDHDWGPRLQLFLTDAAADAGLATAISGLLTARLPGEFRGYPTVFAWSGASPGRHSHHVVVAGLRDWLLGALGFDAFTPVGLLDWLATPTQVLASITGGAVFHDGLAEVGAGLAGVRARLRWYPPDIWLYVLACQWQRISQEEPFPGRCAEVGDELGSMLLAARLARDLMRLVLLAQRRYPPYGKWLGTAFARTPVGADLAPLLAAAISAPGWPDRERSLCAAYEAAARLHNTLGVTAPLDPAVRPNFYDRPFRISDAGRFVGALRDRIGDETVRSLPLIGAVDQFVDSTDAIGNHALRRAAVGARFGPAVSGTDRRPAKG